MYQAGMKCGGNDFNADFFDRELDIRTCSFNSTGACMCLGPMPGDVQPDTDGGQFEYSPNCDPAKLGLMKMDPWTGGEVPDYAALPDDCKRRIGYR